MKKVLALVLVAVMAFGMASVGFAADLKAKGLYADNISYGYGYASVYRLGESYRTYVDPADGQKKSYFYGYQLVEKSIGKERKGNLNLTSSTASYSADVRPQDKVKDYINLYVGMFDWGTDGTVRYLPDYAAVVPGFYKLNADGTFYTDANGDYVWEDYAVYWNEFELVTGADIRSSKIAVRTAVSAGSKAIDNVEIKNKDGVIEIKYVEEWVSTDSLDFEFTVYLTIDGKSYRDQGLTFIGTLANPIQEVYKNDDYVNLADGSVAEAMEFVPEIEVDLGNGVSIFTKFFKTKKYYGTCTRDRDEYDDAVFAKYLDVDNVVTLKTVGLNSTGDIVKLSTDYNNYWVYDKDMNYLGQSNQRLPYSTKYYLANKQLNVVGDVADEITEAPSTGDTGLNNPETGGDDLPSNNPNGNPSTGR